MPRSICNGNLLQMREEISRPERIPIVRYSILRNIQRQAVTTHKANHSAEAGRMDNPAQVGDGVVGRAKAIPTGSLGDAENDASSIASGARK